MPAEEATKRMDAILSRHVLMAPAMAGPAGRGISFSVIPEGRMRCRHYRSRGGISGRIRRGAAAEETESAGDGRRH